MQVHPISGVRPVRLRIPDPRRVPFAGAPTTRRGGKGFELLQGPRPIRPVQVRTDMVVAAVAWPMLRASDPIYCDDYEFRENQQGSSNLRAQCGRRTRRSAKKSARTLTRFGLGPPGGVTQ